MATERARCVCVCVFSVVVGRVTSSVVRVGPLLYLWCDTRIGTWVYVVTEVVLPSGVGGLKVEQEVEPTAPVNWKCDHPKFHRPP